MKPWILAVVAALVGLAVGFGMTLTEFAGAGDYFYVENRLVPPIAAKPLDTDVVEAKTPRIFVVGGVTYNFGALNKGQKSSHVFEVKNVGTAPLHLKLVSTTCKCTVGDLKTDTIPPGETGKVELMFDTPNAMPNYRHGATISTNDPEMPELKLTVEGSVLQRVYLMPDSIVFNKISSSESAAATFGIFRLRVADFQITKHEFLNPEAEKFFEVAFGDVPPRLLASQAGKATEGTLITVRTKPGLPYGRIRETLRVTTNHEGQTFDVAIGGSVIADVSIVGGSRYDIGSSVYNLGVVDQEEGSDARLLVLVKGAHRDETKVKLVSAEPANVLQATLGPRETREKLVSYSLQLTVPKGAPRANHLSPNAGGLGKILLETTDPKNKEMIIWVRFAVE